MATQMSVTQLTISADDTGRNVGVVTEVAEDIVGALSTLLPLREDVLDELSALGAFDGIFELLAANKSTSLPFVLATSSSRIVATLPSSA
jgi:hypothetical protein